MFWWSVNALTIWKSKNESTFYKKRENQNKMCPLSHMKKTWMNKMGVTFFFEANAHLRIFTGNVTASCALSFTTKYVRRHWTFELCVIVTPTLLNCWSIVPLHINIISSIFFINKCMEGSEIWQILWDSFICLNFKSICDF